MVRARTVAAVISESLAAGQGDDVSAITSPTGTGNNNNNNSGNNNQDRRGINLLWKISVKSSHAEARQALI
jgi:hypothetical protein